MLRIIKICAVITLLSTFIALGVSIITDFSDGLLCVDLLLVCCCSLMWSLYFVAKRRQDN